MAIYGPDGTMEIENIGGTSGFTSLNAKSAVSDGDVLDNRHCRSHHTMVVISGSGVTAGSVQLQGSLDNVDWFDLGSAVSTTAASKVYDPVVVSSQPVRSLRASIATAITGGTITAVVASAG